MSKPAKRSSGPKTSTAGTFPRRKVGRDLFAVLIVGLGLATSLAWVGIDTSKARALINNAAAQVQQLASNTSSPALSARDAFPVSSIGGKTRIKPGDISQYPVCSGGAGRSNCIVDGDTFHMNGTTIRISDIDAPETHPPRCAREADLGDRATSRLSILLSAGPFQLVRQNRDIDKYGRQLRVVVRNGRSIGKMLVNEGLARPWTGKRRPWCGASDSASG